jgi:pilus assembly protein Flp/PilA
MFSKYLVRFIFSLSSEYRTENDQIIGGEKMLEKMKNLIVEEEGQGLSEYGLIVAAIVVVAAAAAAMFNDELVDLFQAVKGVISGSASTPSASI